MKLKEAQDRSYELLCLIDDICRREGVTYFLTGGSEIGAVREKNLIPWDDDIDINVRLSDYPAFRDAMRRNLPKHIKLIEPEDFSPTFYDFLVRVVDTTAPRRRDSEENRYYNYLQDYLCIDVFFIYHMPESKIRWQLSLAHQTMLYGLGMAHRYRMDYSKYSLPQKVVAAALWATGHLVPARSICRRYYQVLTRVDQRYRHSPEAYINLFTGNLRQKAAWFESAAEGELRGRKFPICGGYDEELTSYYGDYMHPPKDRSIYVQHLDKEEQWDYSHQESSERVSK